MPETVYAPLASLGDRLAAFGVKRILILASSERHVAAARAALARFEVSVFAGARVHVPAETVELATKGLDASGADTLVAIGGGSPIGLAKALKLATGVRFVAVPTTYAGSEMTNLYGITRGRDKQTGRDDKVRPDLVLYDVALTLDLPVTLSVQSLWNALAHVVSVLSTDSIEARPEALTTARLVVEAADAIVASPRDRAARESAQRAASACGRFADLGKPGAQHGLAHLLGGAFNVDHAALHAILLPHFIAHLDRTQPALITELTAAIGEARKVHERPTIPDLSAAALAAMSASSEPPERLTMRDITHIPELATRLRALLGTAGAPITLSAIGVTRAELERVLATRPELPARIALDALT